MKRERVKEIFNKYLCDEIILDQAIDLICECEPRKPIGICPETPHTRMTTVCDDGSVFVMIEDNTWIQTHPIPGTRADLEESNGE
jgi:hypothetical protein